MNSSDQTILLLDSETKWLMFGRNTLQDNGFHVAEAQSLPEAQALISDRSTAGMWLTLLDADLLDGIDFNNEVSRSLAETIFLSAPTVAMYSRDLGPQEMRTIFKMGAVDCAGKPYDSTSLLALVEHTLATLRIHALGQREVVDTTLDILVIDDDMEWRELLVQDLPGAGIIATASDFESAVSKLSAQTWKIVVCDLRLTDTDETNFQGMDILRFVRQQDRDRDTLTHIIVVSAFGTQQHVYSAYQAFHVDYYFDKRYLSLKRYRESIQALLASDIGPLHMLA